MLDFIVQNSLKFLNCVSFVLRGCVLSFKGRELENPFFPTGYCNVETNSIVVLWEKENIQLLK